MFYLNGEPVKEVPDGFTTDDEGNIISKELRGMGDRFYQQQLKLTGKTPGDKKEHKAPRLLKADVLTELPEIAGLKKLTMEDLQKLVKSDCLTQGIKLVMPEGRLKAPYVAQAAQLQPDVDWAKLTVAELKELISYFIK